MPWSKKEQGRSQSPRSSDEAGNDRGAKGDRKGDIRQKTGRLGNGPLSDIVAETNQTLKGWFGYFKHSVLQTFKQEDGWIRGRLRAILRHRHKLQGRGRDHQRWPNAYFADLGLFSLAIARRQASQLQR